MPFHHKLGSIGHQNYHHVKYLLSVRRPARCETRRQAFPHRAPAGIRTILLPGSCFLHGSWLRIALPDLNFFLDI